MEENQSSLSRILSHINITPTIIIGITLIIATLVISKLIGSIQASTILWLLLLCILTYLINSASSSEANNNATSKSIIITILTLFVASMTFISAEKNFIKQKNNILLDSKSAVAASQRLLETRGILKDSYIGCNIIVSAEVSNNDPFSTGNDCYKEKNYLEAEKNYMQAIEQLEKLPNGDIMKYYKLSTVYLNLGITLAKQGEIEKAKKALGMSNNYGDKYRKNYNENVPTKAGSFKGYISAYETLSMLHIKYGKNEDDSYMQSEQILNKALEIWQENTHYKQEIFMCKEYINALAREKSATQ